MTRWQRLTRAQLVMSVLIGALALGAAALIVQAYLNISATSNAFERGYILTDLAGVNRGVLRLRMETENNLRARSYDMAQAEIQRALLEHQVRLTTAEAAAYPLIRTSMAELQALLLEYDGVLARLSQEPTPGNLSAAEPSLDRLLIQMEAVTRQAYNREEEAFFTSVGQALQVQRGTQRVLLWLMAVLPIFGALLATSLRGSVDHQFREAYRLLEHEVKVRQQSETEQRRQNTYLAALHDTSVGLMEHLDLSDLLGTILARAVQLLSLQDGLIYLADEPGETLEIRLATGHFGPLIGHRMRRGEGLCGKVLAEARSIAVDDYATWPGRADGIDHADVHAVVGVPLYAGSRPMGVLGVGCTGECRDRRFSQAEIDLLSRFAQLASIALENARLFEAAETRAHELDALYRADAELYRHLDLHHVLQSLTNVAVDLLGAEKSLVLSWTETGERLVVRAARGFSEVTLREIREQGHSLLIGRVAAAGEPVWIENAEADGRVDRALVRREGIRSLVHVPIVVDGEVFGVFNVSYVSPRAFGREERRVIQALAQRAGLAIENARLYARAQNVATLEERQRLARELHDAVTQTLFSTCLIAEVLPRIWERDPEAGRHRLQELHQLTRGALAEMRALLMELRPASLVEANLLDLLTGLADAAGARARLDVHLEVAGERRELPPDPKVALYRIAQEALNNTAKHAAASRVDIQLRYAADAVYLSVTDDGRGFEPGNASPESLGLEIMGERAAMVGACVAIHATPGAGTRVEAQWPARPQGEALASGGGDDTSAPTHPVETPR